MLKAIQTKVGTTADGIFGPKTAKAICAALAPKNVDGDLSQTVKNIQTFVGTTPDGIWGPKTEAAVAAKLGIQAPAVDPLVQKYIDKPVVVSMVDYKAAIVSQSSVRSNKSIYGRAGDESYLVNVPVPENYPLRYDGNRVKTIRVHKLVADRMAAILQDTINHYGEDIEKVAPGLCVYDGSYYYRNTTNGSVPSIHAWGLAIDMDAGHNSYSVKKPNARLSQPIYEPFWKIVAAHGGASLGKKSDYDWMHYQFTTWG